MGKWRRHLFEGVAANLEADPDGPPKGTMLKGPWRDLDPRGSTPGSTALGDRLIVHRWKNRGKTWSHAENWAGVATELMARFRKADRRPDPRQARTLHAERDLPRLPRGPAQPRARAVRVGGKTLVELGAMADRRGRASSSTRCAGRPAATCATRPVPLDPLSRTIAEELLKEIRGRLGFLTNVGLHYLTLDRAAPTLSGGEAQRIRLASQVGAGLVGVLYILDEPSIGLHPRDNDRLIATLQRLRDVGNTVIVVEHDEDTMRAADHLVDFGPGPGVKGGEVVAEGTIADLAEAPESLTGQYLSGRRAIAVPDERKAADRYAR